MNYKKKIKKEQETRQEKKSENVSEKAKQMKSLVIQAVKTEYHRLGDLETTVLETGTSKVKSLADSVSVKSPLPRGRCLLTVSWYGGRI